MTSVSQSKLNVATFAQGLTLRHGLLDLIDVGADKGEVDRKIKGMKQDVIITTSSP